jgi:hypothetical protein
MLGEQCVVRKKLPAVDYGQRRKFPTRRSVVALRFVARESLDTRLRFWPNLRYIYRGKTCVVAVAAGPHTSLRFLMVAFSLEARQVRRESFRVDVQPAARRCDKCHVVAKSSPLDRAVYKRIFLATSLGVTT